MKECFGIDFLPHDDSSQRLLAFARQEVGPESLRGQKRLVTQLPVRILHRGLMRKEFIADLSSGGAFVRSGIPLSVGDLAGLQLRPPGALLQMTINARVAWVRSLGSAPGMGFEFLDEGPKARQKLDKLLEKLERS